MVRFISVALLLFLYNNTFSQYNNQIKWSFTSREVAENQYEVRFIASIQSPWHIYSQNSPAGVTLPTEIIFNKNPLLKITSQAKESGTLQKKVEDGDTLKYYSKAVEFIQLVTTRTKARINLSGNINYMLCNDRECLPPANKIFSIPLESKN